MDDGPSRRLDRNADGRADGRAAEAVGEGCEPRGQRGGLVGEATRFDRRRARHLARRGHQGDVVMVIAPVEADQCGQREQRGRFHADSGAKGMAGPRTASASASLIAVVGLTRQYLRIRFTEARHPARRAPCIRCPRRTQSVVAGWCVFLLRPAPPCRQKPFQHA